MPPLAGADPVSYTHLDDARARRAHRSRVGRAREGPPPHRAFQQRLQRDGAGREGDLVRSGPVSYTHLDVYKRQDIGFVNLINFGLALFRAHTGPHSVVSGRGDLAPGLA